jgi:hypothetical protein
MAVKTKAIQSNSMGERELTTAIRPQTTAAIGLQNKL